ncbi:MAG: alanine--tRNA ligase [candidate division Zixibacteria bacterium]|nr:alanine--tRNA ligase [candidate division Zixibacteria bacterium]
MNARTPTIKTSEIRQSFLAYFQRRKHTLVPSSPVIPFDDPTILFTNAGMNQFKDVFTGKRRTEYSRATSSQKCIRAGGKHNDLDNVGFTARHHTFFEMLGNFSFGDYYKEEAIYYAWEWVTRELELPKDRLYATVYETDDDAFALWEKIAPDLRNGRVLRFGKHDNFWSMGDVGPCGPCSEIHFDRGEKYGVGPDHTVNGETDRFIEVWNLVFMQDDQLPDGRVVPLPKPSVDTGAGLERLAAVKQYAESNYGIDLFQNIIVSISDITGARYRDNIPSHHVIADHIRALTFAIADGAGISNEGRGYVLRRILRRAARHGRLLGAHEPFMYRLVPVLVNEMGQAYPEIREKQAHVESVVRAEEESFMRTLETGLQLFERVSAGARKSGRTVIDGEEVFRLYDTYGFPYDLTEIIAAEQGLTLDRQGFDRAMAKQQEQSRAGAAFKSEAFAHRDEFDALGLNLLPTEFVRGELTVNADVMAAVGNNQTAAVVLNRTPFYIEAGGQISDTGRLFTETFEMEVLSLHLYNDLHFHVGHVTRGTLDDLRGREPVKVTAQVEAARRWDIMRNHTATHLAHAALRKVLGDHVKQSGSYVGPDRLRFDFSHHQPMTPEEIAEVERIVNNQILSGKDVATRVMALDDARKAGAMALFGEKYGEKVRVVSVEGFSMELCGGTHVENISQIGPFFVTVETGIASGVRRMEAITGRTAIDYMLANKRFKSDVAALVNRPEADALDGVKQLRETISTFQKELKKAREQMFAGGGELGESRQVGGVTIAMNDFGDSDRDVMAAWLDRQKAMANPVVAVAVGITNGKRAFMAAASNAAVADKKLDVGQMTKVVLPKFGGRGGGKESFAQGGVDAGASSSDVFEAVLDWVQKALTR